MMNNAPKESKPKRSPANALAWALIALLATLTAAWMVWAAHQPEVRSSWTP
jgi:hypothetical protein